MALVNRDPGDEHQWRPAEMPRRVYSSPDAVLGVRTVAYLDEHRERLLDAEYGPSPRLMFARWLYREGRISG